MAKQKQKRGIKLKVNQDNYNINVLKYENIDKDLRIWIGNEKDGYDHILIIPKTKSVIYQDKVITKQDKVEEIPGFEGTLKSLGEL